MNTKEWEKTMRDIGVVSKIHPEIVDEYILICKEAISSYTQEIRDAINEIEIKSDSPENDGVADIYKGFWENTLKPRVLQILESNE